MIETTKTSALERGIHSASATSPGSGLKSAPQPRRFDFERDSFAFANELHWEYRFDPASGKTTFSRRVPKPTYAHRCFVLTRATRQFLYHARFDAESVSNDCAATCRRQIQEVLARDPRTPSQPGREVLFSGHANLREFSQAQETLLKAECGGAWRSYVLRSHWRMVFPISRAHQDRTAARLRAEIQRGVAPIIHLVRFPQLTINHGMILFDARDTPTHVTFQAYDPNQPAGPTKVSFDRAIKTFSLPANLYWGGGRLDVIEIYRGWLM